MNGAVWHDIRRTLRDGLPLALIGAGALLFLIPLGTAAVPGDSIFDISVTHEQMKYRLIGDAFLPAVQSFAVLFGLFFGLYVFRFLLEPERSASVFSLPMSRKALYLGRFFTGLASIMGVILLPMALSLALNLMALRQDPGLLPAWLYLCLGLFVTASITYAITAIAVALAGNVAEAVFFTGAFLSAPYVFSFAASVFMKRLLWGNPYGVAPYIGGVQIMPPATELLSPFNPAVFFYGELQRHRMFYRPLASDIAPPIHPGLTFAWLGGCAILGFLGYICFVCRRAEQAGFPGKNKPIYHVCAFVPALFLSAFTFDLGAEAGLAFGTALTAAVFVVCSVVSGRAMGGGRSKADFLKTRVLPVGIAAIALLALAAGAASGYGAYASLPTLSGIAAVRASYVGNPNLLGLSAAGSCSEVGYYVAAGYTFTEPEDIALALRLHGMFNEGGRRAMQKGKKDYSATVVPYDIRFDYTGKDGKTKTWYYDRASLAELRALLELECTAPAKTGALLALGGEGAATSSFYAREAFLYGNVYLADMTYRDIFALTLSTEWRAELLAWVREDIAGQSIESRYFPAGEPLAVLMFTFNGDSDIETFAYHLNNALLFLDEAAYPRTLAFLRDNGLWFDETWTDLAASTDIAEIDTMILQEYDPYIGINKPAFPQSLYFMGYLSKSGDSFRVIKDFGVADVIRDPERMAAILPRLRCDWFLSTPGSLVAVKYKGSDKWVYKFAPESEYSNGPRP